MNQNALHWAAKRGMKAMAEFLLQNGIDFNWKDMAQRTPEDLARKNEFFEVAKIIEYFKISEQKKQEAVRDIGKQKIDLNFNL